MIKIFISLILFFSFYSTVSADVDKFKVGGIFCLTGEIASGCNAIREGVEVGLDLINKSGGIDGRLLEIDLQDSYYTPKGAHSLGVKFSSNKDILAVLVTGIVETKAASAPLEKMGKPYITLWDSAPSIEALGDYSFGIGPWLPNTYELSAEFTFNNLGKKKVAVAATEAEWSISVSKGFNQHFTKLGGKITSFVTTVPNDPDFRSVLIKLLKTKPDAVYAPITSNLIPFFKQIRQLGFTGPIITSDNLTEELIVESKGAFEGAYQTMVADPDTKESEKLKSLYKAKFSKKATMLAFHGWGYDGIRLIAEAIRRSNKSGETIRESLLSIKDFQGASGTISFSKEGSWRMPLKVFEVKGKSFIPVT
jgi:branched-chain amino acid transport system substrate-binding protein